MDTFKTITQNSEAQYKEKGSKFIGFAFPVSNEMEINATLNDLKEQHPKATHHCYAYKFGTENTTSRANDDGEPSSSAGKPILGQIESFELTNTLIVVVRYYGGTKLGVGGLQSAYKAVARLALEENKIIEKEVPCFFEIQFPFDLQGIVDHLIKNLNGEILEKQFTTTVSYQLQIPKANVPQFEERIRSERTIVLSTKNL